MNATISIRIDSELADLLEQTARRTGRPKSELIRDALRRQLNIETFQQLRKELLPFGESKGWLTDEDVFGEVS